MYADETILASFHSLPHMTHGQLQRICDRSEGELYRYWQLFDSAEALSIGYRDQDIPAVMEAYQQCNPFLVEQYLHDHGVAVLFASDPVWPESLRYVQPSFTLLYVQGQLTLFDGPAITVVGARRITAYGISALQQIIAPVLRCGVGLVSGLAQGVDQAGHLLALDVGVPTVAFLGHGVGVRMSSRQQRIAGQIIAAGGAVISEFPLFATARPFHFPLRNRLVAGAGDLTVIIEAGAKSGTMITAKLALDLGKDVFAVPGSIFAEQSHGCLALLERSEAHPCWRSAQLIDALGLQNLAAREEMLTRSPVELSWFRHIPEDPETIMARAGVSPQEFLEHQSLLELGGWIRQKEGKWFRLDEIS